MSVEVSSEDLGLDLEPIQYMYLKGGELLHGIPQETSNVPAPTQGGSHSGYHGGSTGLPAGPQGDNSSSMIAISQQYRSLIAEVVQQLEDMGDDPEEENAERASMHCEHLQVSLSVWYLMEIFIIRTAEERSHQYSKDPSMDMFTTIRFAEWLNEQCLPTIDETEVNEVLVKIRNGNYPPPDIWRSVAALLSNAQIVEAANVLKASASLMYSQHLRSLVDVLLRFPLVSSVDMPTPREYDDHWREWFLATRALRRSIPPDLFHQFKVLEPLFDLFEGDNISDALHRLRLIAEKVKPSMSEENLTSPSSPEDAEVGWMNVAICSLFFKQPITQVSASSLDDLFRECLRAVDADPGDWIFRCFTGCLKGNDSEPLSLLLEKEQRWVVAHLLEILHRLGYAKRLRTTDHSTWGTRLNRGLFLDVAIDLLSMPSRSQDIGDDMDLDEDEIELSELLRVPALYAKYVSHDMADTLYSQFLPSKVPQLGEQQCHLLYEFLQHHCFDSSKEVLVRIKLRHALGSLYRRLPEQTNGAYDYRKWIADPQLTISQYETVLTWGDRSTKRWLFDLVKLLSGFCFYLVENISRYKGDDILILANAFETGRISQVEDSEKLEKIVCLLYATGLTAYIRETEQYISTQQSNLGREGSSEEIAAEQELARQFRLKLCCILHDALLGTGRNGIKDNSLGIIPMGLASLPAVGDQLFPSTGSRMLGSTSHGYAPTSPILRDSFNVHIAIRLLDYCHGCGAFDPGDPVCTSHLVSGFLTILQQVKLDVSGLSPSIRTTIDYLQQSMRKYYPYAVLQETGSTEVEQNPYQLTPLERNTKAGQEHPEPIQPSNTPYRGAPPASSGFRQSRSGVRSGMESSKKPPVSAPEDTLPSPPAFAATPARQSTSLSRNGGTLTEKLNRLRTPPSRFSRGFMS